MWKAHIFFLNFIRHANKLQRNQFSRTFLEYVYWLVEQNPKIIKYKYASYILQYTFIRPSPELVESNTQPHILLI